MSAARFTNSLGGLRAAATTASTRVPQGYRGIATSKGLSSKIASETESSPESGDGNAASYRGGEGLRGLDGEDKPKPKVANQSIPGVRSGLNEEQKREVEGHNKDFENSHERGQPAPEDKVDKKFWQRSFRWITGILRN